MSISHIAIYVIDLESAKEFFIEYFGARQHPIYENKKTGLRSYFLSFAEGAQLELMYRPEIKGGEKEPVCAGYTHISFCAGGREEVDKLTFRLQKDGYKVLSGPRITGDGFYESVIEGPEGNLIEITE